MRQLGVAFFTFFSLDRKEPKGQESRNAHPRGLQAFAHLGAYLSNADLSGAFLSRIYSDKRSIRTKGDCKRRQKYTAGTIAATVREGLAKRPEGPGLP